jgi:hypothetical protein
MLNKKNGLSAYKQKKIMWAFAVDLTATQAAHMLGLDRKTINRYYQLFRLAIHAYQKQQIAALVGIVECDESYFGQARPRGVPGPRKRGRGTNKPQVFGIFERGRSPPRSGASIGSVLYGGEATRKNGAHRAIQTWMSYFCLASSE